MPLSFDKSLNFQDSLHFQNSLSISYMPPNSYPSDTSTNYDMNELPYISQSRSLLVVVCVIMFFTAASIYFPLGSIQADYDGKCFLYTDLHFESNQKQLNSSKSDDWRLNPVNTEWGADFHCNMTTFTPVMVAILTMIIGWSTFTVWPIMMEIGKGGGLMLVYAFFFTLCLGSMIASFVILFNGYRSTCNSLNPTSVTCEELNLLATSLKVDGDHVKVLDVHSTIVIAEVASAALVGLSCLQIFISLGTFGIIWYHFHFLAQHLYADEESVEEEHGNLEEAPWLDENNKLN